MTLARLQAELAALLMEPGRLEAFEADPKGYVRKAGLAGRDADLLAGLPVEGARYFAERRRIDRFSHLRGDLPHSVAMLEREAGVAAYFAAHPYAFEEPMKEVARFAKWSRGASLPRILRDVVAVEAAAVLLMHGPRRAAKPGARLRRAPGVRLVRVAHDPEHFLHDHAWTPEPGAFTVVLQRTADDVENPVLKPAELDALKAANGRRTDAQIVAHLLAKGHPKAKARAALARLCKLGLVA
ncbi:MAG: hypothetical protein QOG31_92 [Thermoplasmata archaeon]|nr:hypothetical protein [Thermoplasmata archaeon]